MSNRKLGDFDGNGVVNAGDSSALTTYIGKISRGETVDPPITTDDFYAGNLLKINDLVRQDIGAIIQTYAKTSTDARMYPKTAPANWATDYINYYYLDENGNPVSLASVTPAPTWEANKYFYLDSHGYEDVLGEDFVSPLVTHLP